MSLISIKQRKKYKPMVTGMLFDRCLHFTLAYYRQSPKMILPVCRVLEFSPAQANQALIERLVRELAPV